MINRRTLLVLCLVIVLTVLSERYDVSDQQAQHITDTIADWIRGS